MSERLGRGTQDECDARRPDSRRSRCSTTRRSAASRISSCCARSSSSSSTAPRPTRSTIWPKANIASGFGFWNNTAGFDISQTLIEYSHRLDLWPRILGRPAQYAAGRRDRHRACDHPRLHRRHAAAVEEFPDLAARRRLCRDDPQSAAAAAIAVLVQRRAQGAAGIARQPGRFRAASSSTIAACSCRSRSRSSGFARGLDLVLRRHRRLDRFSHHGRRSVRNAPASRRRSFLVVARPDRRLAAHRVSSSPACRSN